MSHRLSSLFRAVLDMLRVRAVSGECLIEIDLVSFLDALSCRDESRPGTEAALAQHVWAVKVQAKAGVSG